MWQKIDNYEQNEKMNDEWLYNEIRFSSPLNFEKIKLLLADKDLSTFKLDDRPILYFALKAEQPNV